MIWEYRNFEALQKNNDIISFEILKDNSVQIHFENMKVIIPNDKVEPLIQEYEALGYSYPTLLRSGL